MIQWADIDTVLLDLDGTLLDLHYDNRLWNELLPERFGQHVGMDVGAASDRLLAEMRAVYGTREFYCLDYWCRVTGLDVIALHHDLVHLIRYRPGAERFLAWLRASGRRSVLVTNAHRGSVDVKDRHARLLERLDADVSCHDYGAPKESQLFWQQLLESHPFDPARTLFIDDNAPVLDAAAQFGVRHLLTVVQPDSGRPARAELRYPAFNDFAEIIP